MSMGPGLISAEAARKTAGAVREVDRMRGRNANGGQPPAMTRHAGDGPWRIAITTEIIAPNTYGGFKFTTGAKGSETATGNELQGFYRPYKNTGAPSIPANTKCYAVWIDCDSLEVGDGETGWELNPCVCLDS